jgi:hypothetical protein
VSVPVTSVVATPEQDPTGLVGIHLFATTPSINEMVKTDVQNRMFNVINRDDGLWEGGTPRVGVEDCFKITLPITPLPLFDWKSQRSVHSPLPPDMNWTDERSLGLEVLPESGSGNS